MGRLPRVLAVLLVPAAAVLSQAWCLRLGFLEADYERVGRFFAADGAFQLPRDPGLGFPFGFRPFWTHMGDAYFWGVDPVGHHLTGLLLHALTALAVLAACRRFLPGEPWAAAAAALFFALSPLAAGAAGWVSGRDVALAALLGWLGLLALTRRPPAPTAAVTLYALGVLTHPAALTLPLAALLFETLGRRRPLRALPWGAYLPIFLVLALTLVYLRVTGQRLWHTDRTLANLAPAALLGTLERLVLPLNGALTRPDLGGLLRWVALGVGLPLGLFLGLRRAPRPGRALAAAAGAVLLAALAVGDGARLAADLQGGHAFYAALPFVGLGAALLLSRRAAGIAGRLLAAAYAVCLGVLTQKESEAFLGAAGVLRHLQGELREAARLEPAETLLFLAAPPARYGGAPVAARGLRASLAPPFGGDAALARRVIPLRDPELLRRRLAAGPPTPLLVLWLPVGGRDPRAPLERVSPLFTPATELPPPWTPPLWTGRRLAHWEPRGGFAAAVTAAGLRGPARGGDGQLISPPLAVPRRWVAAVEVEMAARHPRPLPVDLFWAPPGAAFTAARRVRRLLPADGAFHRLTLPLPPRPGKGYLPLLGRLRLDPAPFPVAEVRVRRLRLVPGPAAPKPQEEAAAWRGRALAAWRPGPGTRTEVDARGLRITTAGNDPYVVSPPLEVPTDGLRAVALTLRVDATSDLAALYWTTDREPRYAESRTRRFRVQAGDGQFHRYVIYFRGRRRLPPGARLTGLRVDPMAGPGQAWLRSVTVYRVRP